MPKPDFAAEWPYDADENDPLAAHRIPVVGSPHPWWNYIVALYDGSLFGSKNPRPTEQETRMLGSFLEEYKARWYGEGYLAVLAERPFDIDGGANGYTFQKYGEEGWGYRQRTWECGPQFVRAHSLAALMDRVHSHGDDKTTPRWVAWKAVHPGVFTEQSA